MKKTFCTALLFVAVLFLLSGDTYAAAKNWWPMPIGSWWKYSKVYGPSVHPYNPSKPCDNSYLVMYVKPPSGAFRFQTSRTLHIYGEDTCSYPHVGYGTNHEWAFQLVDSPLYVVDGPFGALVGPDVPWLLQRGVVKYGDKYSGAPPAPLEWVSGYPFAETTTGEDFGANKSRDASGNIINPDVRFRHGYDNNYLAPNPYLYNHYEGLTSGTEYPLTFDVGTTWGSRDWTDIKEAVSSWEIQNGNGGETCSNTDVKLRYKLITKEIEFTGRLNHLRNIVPGVTGGLEVFWFEHSDDWCIDSDSFGTACEKYYFIKDLGVVRIEATSIDVPTGDGVSEAEFETYCDECEAALNQWADDQVIGHPEYIDSGAYPYNNVTPNVSVIYDLKSSGKRWNLNWDTNDSHFANEEFGFDSPDAMAMTSFYTGGSLDSPMEITYVKDSRMYTVDSRTGEWLYSADLNTAWPTDRPPAVIVDGVTVNLTDDDGPEAMAYGRAVKNIFGGGTTGALVMFNKGAYWLMQPGASSRWVKYGALKNLKLGTNKVPFPAGVYSNGGPDAATIHYTHTSKMYFFNNGNMYLWNGVSQTWSTNPTWSPNPVPANAPVIRGKRPLNPDAVLMGNFMDGMKREILYAQEGRFWIYSYDKGQWEQWDME
jgi:hypothetical protein